MPTLPVALSIPKAANIHNTLNTEKVLNIRDIFILMRLNTQEESNIQSKSGDPLGAAAQVL